MIMIASTGDVRVMVRLKKEAEPAQDVLLGSHMAPEGVSQASLSWGEPGAGHVHLGQEKERKNKTENKASERPPTFTQPLHTTIVSEF